MNSCFMLILFNIKFLEFGNKEKKYEIGYSNEEITLKINVEFPTLNSIFNSKNFLEDENKLIYKPAFFYNGNLIWGATANILTELLVKI